MLASLLVLVIASVVFVQQAGGLSPLVERQLTKISDQINVRVSDAGFDLQWSSRPVILKSYDVQMQLQESTLQIPSAEFEFGLATLLTGQPEKLVLRGLDLDLVKTANGWDLPKIMGITAPLLGRKDAPGASGALATGLAMRKIGIDAVSMTLSDATGVLPPVRFADLYFDFESLATGSLTGSLRGRHVIDGANTEAGAANTNTDADADADADVGDFTATFTSWPGGDRFAVDLTAQQLNLTDIIAYTDFVSPDLQRLGSLSGHVGVNVEDSKIALLEADITLQNGTFGTFGGLSAPEFASAQVIGTYARSQKALNIAKSDITMADGRGFGFVGAVNDIGTSSIAFAGRLQADNVSLQSILADWPDAVAKDYKSALDTHVDSGYLTEGSVQMAGRINPSSRAFTLSQFDFDGRFSGLRVNFATDQYQRAVGTVDGGLAVRMGTQGKINALKFDAAVSDGSVLLAGRDKPVIVKAANLQAEFADGIAVVENATVDFAGDGRLAMTTKLDLTDQMRLNASATQMNTDDFDAALFAALWPEQAAPVTRRWIRQNMTSGRIRDAEITFGTGYDADTKKQNLHHINGNFSLRDSTLGWSEKSPPFTNLSADLAIDNAAFVANITNARFGDMAVQHGKVTISPVVEPVAADMAARQASLSIAMKGALTNAVDHAKTSGVTSVANLDISDMLAAGEAELILQARFPLDEKINALKAIQKLDATISNGSFSNLPGGVFIDDAELVVAFDKSRSDISGTASIMGAPGEFSVQFDREKETVTAIGLASPSPELADLLADRLQFRLAGQLGGKLVYTGDLANNTAELQIAAPLTGVSIDVPLLNWAKLPAEAGQASMVIDLRGGELAAINNIDIVAGSLVAQGQVAFDTSGAVQAGFFERVAWPGNDIRDLIIESNQDKSWQVGASAKIIDLVPLRRNKGVSGGETINFDFTADQIIVDDQISLSGQLVGARSADGAGNAEFSGSLLVRGEPLITEAQFGIAFGAGDDAIAGIGLIGGGETNFNFVDSTDGKPTLVLTSKNGGRMLSGLDITDTVRGGDVRLETIFESEDYKSYNTRIDIEDFAVIEAPRAVRAFSVLSLAGLYALVEGDGTGFKAGLAELETRGALVKIKALKATGDAVAVNMLGVYDRATKQVDVSGNLVPASQISRFVGEVPLIGNVLTGIDKSGIFTTQFRVTGRSDDMKTSINAASVAPGLLRDLLSPNWLKNEGNRLLDDKDEATNKAAPQTAIPQTSQ
ncbi:AsmA-like C-terminal domain-containing protein [Alphaproteobacteria bacterium]|nr:AsmA-like C-terminal domain-containing protein [Alphaproteobacteria bacterium]